MRSKKPILTSFFKVYTDLTLMYYNCDMIKIIVVEDDRNIRKLYTDILTDEGFHVFSAANGVEALTLFETTKFDLAIIDVMMPQMDGLTLTRTIRDYGIEMPLMIISAKGEPYNIKQGFIAGIDDYMVKPIDTEEFILRIRALLKRAKIATERRITLGRVTFNYESFTVTLDEETMKMPKKEFLLIYKLLSYPNKIFTRYQLLDEIWGLDIDSDENTVNVHINRLRNKFKDRSEFKIETVKGLGYKAVCEK